jgi:hypothetical protein
MVSMAIWDKLIDSISQRVADRISANVQPIVTARAYRSGYYKPQLKVASGQFDDNIGLNLAGLLVNRVVSQMLGGGFTFDFEGDTETVQEQYVNAVLEANKQEVLFHRAGTTASEAGTGYLMILPGGVVGEDGQVYPRLQLVDPLFVTIETLPEDYEVVIRYTIQYKFKNADGKELGRRRVIEHQAPAVAEDGTQSGGDTWQILDYEQLPNGVWVLTGQTPWPYDFPPMLHWQNLPSSHSVYGEPDLTQAQIDLQDRINFVASNISKLIRYYAHPMRYAINASLEKIDVGPDKMVKITGADADIRQLEALGDLTASMNYLTMLRQALFACGRVVDIDSVQDKLGTLTNFGLRVLYADNLNLIATHRELFGDMLEELARRLQILNGMQAIPTTVVWPDFLPVNEVEEQQALSGDLANGLVSKETASRQRGYNWDEESERLQEEQAAGDNIGAAILRAFDRGQGNGGPLQ